MSVCVCVIWQWVMDLVEGDLAVCDVGSGADIGSSHKHWEIFFCDWVKFNRVKVVWVLVCKGSFKICEE